MTTSTMDTLSGIENTESQAENQPESHSETNIPSNPQTTNEIASFPTSQETNDQETHENEDDDDDESTSTTTSSSTTLTSPRNDTSFSLSSSSSSHQQGIPQKSLPTNTYRLSRDIRQTITNSKQRSQSLLNSNNSTTATNRNLSSALNSETKNVKHSPENDYKYYEASSSGLEEGRSDLRTLMSAHMVNVVNGGDLCVDDEPNNNHSTINNSNTNNNNTNNSIEQLCRTLEIQIEKSKTVNKFFIENRDDSAIKDLFSQNCLHLYNGEFTVLKHNEKDFVETQQENVANNSKCLMYHEQGKDIMELATKRITFHPNDFIEDQLNLLTKIYRFRLEAGELEPYFLSLELVNAKTRAKISERFYFHMTSHQLINNFYDELEVKKQLQKQLDHQPKALFSLSHFLKGEPLSDVFAVVFVFKTLQGVSTDQTLKQYQAGKKNHTLTRDTQSECLSGSQTLDDFQGLKHHKEPFLFSFCPLKESGIHAMRYFLPVESLFQLMSNSESDITEGSVGTKKLSHIDAVCEIISQQSESLIHFYTPHNVHERSELKEQLVAESEIAKKNMKKYKPIPGYLVFETYKFNPKKFESDPVERVLLFGSDQEKPMFTTSSAISLEEVIIKIQQRNGSILNPRDPTQEKDLKKCLATSDSINYQNYKVEELHEKLPKFPHFDFSHLLYISPLTLNLEKFKIDSLSCLDADPSLLETLSIKKFKPKNVLVKVEYRESIKKTAQRIISPHGHSLVSEIYCNVLFDADKIVRFLDEIKIALPLPMEKENHLVISFYHLVIEKQGIKRKKTLDSHGNVPKICFGHAVLPIKDIVENHCSKMTDFTYTYTLPIYQKLSGDYLSDSKRLSVSASANIGSMSQKRYDIKKISFVCNTRIVSTIYPNEKLLLQFFADCAPFISITKEGSDSKELSRAVKDCRRSIENLTKVPFSKLVSHFTLIMDMLLSVMCRIPDVIHTFVSESEQQENSSALFGDTTHGLSLTGSSGEDEMLKSITNRFGLAESTSPISNSASLEHKSLSSILAAKRKSVTNSVTNSANSSSHLSLTNPNHPSSATTPVSPSSSGELKKRFSLKNILKRKSKETETVPVALHTSPTSVKKIAQPGEEGFNLIEYLKAQQEQQEQAQHVPEVVIPPKEDKSKNDKLKRRMSLTDRLFNRNKALDQSSEESSTNTSPVAEASNSSGAVRKSITFTASNTDSRGSQSDFGDFLGITSTLFELQKTVFQVIVSMLKGAAIITDCSERSNKLLNTYVNYVFKDIVMTQSPVYVNLVDLFTDVLGKADDELTVSVAVDENDSINQLYQTGESKRNMGGIRKSIQDRFSNKRSSLNEDCVTINTTKNRNSYSMNMSLFALSSSPVFFESLQFCWFFLDLILKSYMLTQREKSEKRSAMNDVEFNLLSEREREALTSDHGYKFTLLLKELVGALAEKAVFYKDDFANFFVSSQINNQLAFFFRDLLGCELIKHEYVFDLMESYFREFMVKKTVTINTIKLCIDFLQILSDHPQFAELNLSVFHPKEYIYHESILCPPVKLLVNLIRDCITKFKSEIDVHNSAIKVLRYILTKEEFTHLSIPNVTPARAELVSRIYFPYVVMLLKNFNALESIPEMTTRQHLKCSVWILSNINPQFFDDWIKSSDQIVIDNLVKLLAFYLDHFEIKGRVKYESSAFKAFQLVFFRLCTHLKERVVSILSNSGDDIKIFEPAHRDLSSFIKMDIRDCEGAKYQTDIGMSEKDFIGYIMFTIAKVMQTVSIGRQKKFNLEMEESTIDLISYYVELFTPIFRANPNSTYWKWLYGALLSGKEFSMATIEGIMTGITDSLYDKLITVLEKVYEKDIINVDNLSKLFDDSSTPESEIILDEENKIKASTLNRLVERVCDQNNSGDSKFTDTFLVTYRSFCTPETLLTLMMSYFEYHVLPKGDQEINSNNKTLVLRMLNTIRLWVQDHSYDFNNCLNASMMHFIYQQVGRLCVIEKSSNSGYISIANKIKERIEANLVCNGESREKLEKMFSRERPQPKYPSKWSEAYEKKSFSIKQWDPQEIAKQITLLDSVIFTAIEPKEFFGLGWTKKDKMVRAPNIVHLTDQFNNLSMFVASDIACEENIKKRVRKVKQWINVAWECKNLNNLNGCNSIVSAFNNAGIHRLKKTWEAIPKKDIENDRLRQLNELVAMTSSYKNMREHMSRSGEGIPYIGIYLTDMVFIEDGNKDYTTKENTDLQLINFAKRRKIAEVIQRIKTQQQTLYDFIPIPFLQRTFDFSSLGDEEKCKILLTDDVIWSKSLFIEPRENK